MSIAIVQKTGGVLTWQDDLAAGFREIGETVTTINLRPSSLHEYACKWRTGGRGWNNPALLTRVTETLRKTRPKLVILLNQCGLPEHAAAAVRTALPRTPLVGWLCDHIRAFPDGARGNLDGVYTFDSATLPVLEQGYAGSTARLAHLPLAVNPQRYKSLDTPFHRRHRALVFAGNHSPARRRLISDYRQIGGRIDGFGPQAECGLQLWRRRRLSPKKLTQLYSGYFAVLNLLQPPNTIHGLNLRAFEIPSAGGLATYPMVPDLKSAFVPGEEVIAYQDLADLKAQIDRLLSDPTRAAAIAAAGHIRTLRNHTFACRARRLRDDWTEGNNHKQLPDVDVRPNTR